MLQSECYRAGAGKLQCTTCHNPHRAVRGDEAVLQYTLAGNPDLPQAHLYLGVALAAQGVQLTQSVPPRGSESWGWGYPGVTAPGSEYRGDAKVSRFEFGDCPDPYTHLGLLRRCGARFRTASRSERVSHLTFTDSIRGNIQKAKEHLRRAASSADATLKSEAEKRLRRLP